MPEIVQEIGAYAGLASVVGLAVLSALYFSQARDVKRLREWAGRAPERSEGEAPAVPGRVTPPAAPAPAQARPGAPAVPGAPAPAVPAGTGARPATAAAASPPRPTSPTPATASAQPAPAQAAAGPKPPGAVPVPAAATAATTAAPAKPDAKPDAAPQAAPTTDSEKTAPAPAAPATESPAPAQKAATEKAPAAGTPAPSAAATAPSAPAGTNANAKRPAAAAPPVPPPARTAPPARKAPPARTAPPVRTGGPTRPAQPTTVIPPPPGDPWYRRLLANPLYAVLAVAGVLILGGAAVFGVSQLAGGDDETPAGQSAAGGDEESASGEPDDESGQNNGNGQATQGAVRPGNVTVAVLNGTTVAGLAATLADQVTAAGFRAGTVANFPPNQELPESVVQYTPGHEREAAAVSRRLGISQREAATADSRELAGDATVIVIAGGDKAP